MVILNNNLGAINIETGNNTEALAYFNKALALARDHNDNNKYGILNNIAHIYINDGRYDEALRHLRMSIAGNPEDPEIKALNLQNMGSLYLGMNLTDSATRYLKLSNAVASESGCMNVLKENYLILSRIEEKKGDVSTAFDYFKTYAHLQDSIYGTDKLGDISQLQSTYEISKANRRIEHMVMERKIKEKTIQYRTIILFVTAGMLLFVSGALLLVWIQKKKLDKAYKLLYEKSKETLTDPSRPVAGEKGKELSDPAMNALLDRIRNVMENTDVICDPDFSVDRLATMVQSNHSSVSKAINIGLNKNFRSYLNGFRIKEAQRILSSHEASRLTMEAVALKVGFRSRNSFSSVFKEITGISPSFYLKSYMQEKSVPDNDHKI